MLSEEQKCFHCCRDLHTLPSVVCEGCHGYIHLFCIQETGGNWYRAPLRVSLSARWESHAVGVWLCFQCNERKPDFVYRISVVNADLSDLVDPAKKQKLGMTQADLDLDFYLDPQVMMDADPVPPIMHAVNKKEWAEVVRLVAKGHHYALDMNQHKMLLVKAVDYSNNNDDDNNVKDQNFRTEAGCMSGSDVAIEGRRRHWPGATGPGDTLVMVLLRAGLPTHYLCHALTHAERKGYWPFLHALSMALVAMNPAFLPALTKVNLCRWFSGRAETKTYAGPVAMGLVIHFLNQPREVDRQGEERSLLVSTMLQHTPDHTLKWRCVLLFLASPRGSEHRDCVMDRLRGLTPLSPEAVAAYTEACNSGPVGEFLKSCLQNMGLVSA